MARWGRRLDAATGPGLSSRSGSRRCLSPRRQELGSKSVVLGAQPRIEKDLRLVDSLCFEGGAALAGVEIRVDLADRSIKRPLHLLVRRGRTDFEEGIEVGLRLIGFKDHGRQAAMNSIPVKGAI